MQTARDTIAAVPLDTQDTVEIAATRARVRVASIDILRGLVIVLMALDHVRDYFIGVRFDPLDLSQTTAALFFTRWVTHFCAPAFVFLAGVSAYLVAQRCTRAELSRFLLTRGAWLILLEFTVVNLAWTFNIRYQYGVLLQVIWVIGASMIVLSVLSRLSPRVIAAISIVLIVGHNLLDGIAPTQFGNWGAVLWSLLHVPSRLPIGYVSYPLIPWVGVMALGYAMGGVFRLEPRRRTKLLMWAGVACLLAFVLLRLTNVYGDPAPQGVQDTVARTLMSFINVEKYPPSLLYLLMTLGAAFVLLAAFESVQTKAAEVLRTFGRVPLFFYVLHIALAHLAAGLIGLAMGFGTKVLTSVFVFLPRDWGFDLPVVYTAWLLLLLTLYPACRWFADVKRRRSDWWLSYL